MTQRTYREITNEERDALQRFADYMDGRKNDRGDRGNAMVWRDWLTHVYWYNARLWTGELGSDKVVGSVLHRLRNDLGPTWLYDVCDVKAAKAQAVRS